jgi:hypothetical protein
MYTQCLTAKIELHTCAKTSTVEDRFATMPAISAVPAYRPPNEEELHTSFELAISNRLIAVNRQLSLVSGPLTDPERVQLVQSTQPLIRSDSGSQLVLPSAQVSMRRLPALFESAWQRCIIYGSLMLALTLVGFDLMGLLVLHAR